jgi:hypothetical protein
VRTRGRTKPRRARPLTHERDRRGAPDGYRHARWLGESRPHFA